MIDFEDKEHKKIAHMTLSAYAKRITEWHECIGASDEDYPYKVMLSQVIFDLERHVIPKYEVNND